MTITAGTADANISAVLRILMAYKHETQQQLVGATGIPQRTLIRRMKNGATGWSAGEVAALADHYEVPVSVFYGGPDELMQGARTSRNFRSDFIAA